MNPSYRLINGVFRQKLVRGKGHIDLIIRQVVQNFQANRDALYLSILFHIALQLDCE